MPDGAEDLGPRSVDGTDWVSQRIRSRSDAFRSNLDRSWRVWPSQRHVWKRQKLTHAHRNVSRELVRCAGVTGSGHIVDAASAERPDSMLADRPPASSSLDETIWRAACKPAAQPISVESRTGASISRPRLCIERAHRALSRADAHDATPRGALASSALPGTWPYTAEMGHSEGGFRAGGR